MYIPNFAKAVRVNNLLLWSGKSAQGDDAVEEEQAEEQHEEASEPVTDPPKSGWTNFLSQLIHQNQV